MKARRVVWGLGGILVLFALTFIVPTVIAFVYDVGAEGVHSRPVDVPGVGWTFAVPETALIFLATGTITATVGLVLQYLGVEEQDLRSREAYAIVGLGWLIITAFGALPYLALGALSSPVDAYLESMSGFTTTGMTTMTPPLESYAPSLMFWRALTQWIGGGGIIVLSIALLAGLTHGGQRLLAAESSGVTRERLRPKVAETAKILWGVYVALTLLLVLLLVLLIHWTGVRLPWKAAVYEALVHAFPAIATGGFSNHDASTGYFDSFAVDVVLGVGMFVGGLSFSLLFLASRERTLKRFLHDPETRFYAAITVAVSLFVSGVVWHAGDGLFYSLRYGFFTTISIITTTGFTPVAFDRWPEAARLMLLFMFFTGACAGSTAGALKTVRLLILFKLVLREMRRLLHPKAVIPVRLGKSILPDDTLKAVSVFFFIYLTLVIFGTIAMTLHDLDIVSAFSISASALGNIGPGLGSTHLDVIAVPPSGKVVLTALMWAGRLEIFTVLVLFSPETWRR